MIHGLQCDRDQLLDWNVKTTKYGVGMGRQVATPSERWERTDVRNVGGRKVQGQCGHRRMLFVIVTGRRKFKRKNVQQHAQKG